MKDKLLLPESTVMDAVSAIENSPQRMSIVIDHEGKLLGTITDGDIRRHILRGRSLNEQVVTVMNKDPITAGLGATKSSINFLMSKNNIIGIPIIDKNRYYIETIYSTDVENFDVKSIPSKNVFSCAVIMAGGEGNRLRPITEDIPKPMIKIGKMPLLEYQIKSLAQLGIKRVYIAEAAPRFAQLIGALFAFVALLGGVSGNTPLFLTATSLALAAAFLNAAFGFCLGCQMYLILVRVRAIFSKKISLN